MGSQSLLAGSPASPHAAGLLGAGISWWNTELGPAVPQRWLLIWKRSRRVGRSFYPRSRLASFPLKRNTLKLWARMGTAKIQGESHCPVLFPVYSFPIQLAVLEIAVRWRQAAQILQAGTTSDNLVLKWWLAFLHTAPALSFISSLISSHLHLRVFAE